MHSIVNTKKPSAPSIVAMHFSPYRRLEQGYSGRLPNPNAGDVANHLLQRRIYGGENSILSNLAHGGAYDMLDRRVDPGLSMNYGLGMQMQLPHSNHLNNGMNWTAPGLIQSRSEMIQQPSVSPSMVATFHANQGHSTAATVSQPSAGLRNMGRSGEEVNLAALIMKEDPTIDAWTALQLAKRHLNGTPSASDLRRPN